MIFSKDTLKRVPKTIWILSAIVLFGAFLRFYNFHNWLDFGSDQVNDATRVGAVVEGKAPWPVYGPDMGNSGKGGRQNRFLLGPIYYDAEIISAKIFGNNPVSMAYPDLIFNILAIPLLFYFLRRIFDKNLSLALTGLYSVSFYALTFSHSAWNVNSIPFFSLLFFLSLYEFIVAKEKTHWGWIVALGVALGVGLQLHAILLVLFPATLFFASIFWLRKTPQAWKKLGAVLVIMVVLNTGQIIGEQQNGFRNSRIFFESATGSSTKSSDPLAVRIANGLSCNFQANTYMLSAVGDGNCEFSLTQYLGGEGNKKITKDIMQPMYIFKAIVCILFSLFGYFALINNFRKDDDKKRKYFFGLMMLYVTLSFFVMLPVLDAALRYFVHMIFLPLIFLGFAIEFLRQKFPKKYVVIGFAIIAMFVATNVRAIYHEVNVEFSDTRIVLGQVEAMVDYMISQSGGQKEVYLFTASKSDDYFKSLQYVANEKNMTLSRAGDNMDISAGKAEFDLNYNDNIGAGNIVDGHSFDNYKNFNQNQVTLFHLTN